ncbi:MAG: Mut7-C RNAse domain-containing protein [Candidatus Nitrosotenuis sp.]|nr:Mut7-C RNAse domain-containing protein [Candidatus Nitrosotenuis sp.]
MSPPRFVADSMLGTLSKKLRILGFDCKYFSAIGDDDIALLAKDEGRILVTRDRQLALRCQKQNINTICLVGESVSDHLVHIAREAGIAQYQISTPGARCTICNGMLNKMDHVPDEVPPWIKQNVKQFWSCADCGHIYWQGTHIRNLERLIGEINARL